MKAFRAFQCGRCGDEVELRSCLGRTREVGVGVVLPLPDDARVATRRGCGETWSTAEEAAELDALQAPAFGAWQAAHCKEVVARTQATHPGPTPREIERACGVTATHLSHVLSGRGGASATLTRLLEVTSLSLFGYERQRDGRSREDAMRPFSAPCVSPARRLAAGLPHARGRRSPELHEPHEPARGAVAAPARPQPEANDSVRRERPMPGNR